jgi:hypothetical protein
MLALWGACHSSSWLDGCYHPIDKGFESHLGSQGQLGFIVLMQVGHVFSSMFCTNLAIFEANARGSGLLSNPASTQLSRKT